MLIPGTLELCKLRQHSNNILNLKAIKIISKHFEQIFAAPLNIPKKHQTPKTKQFVFYFSNLDSPKETEGGNCTACETKKRWSRPHVNWSARTLSSATVLRVLTGQVGALEWPPWKVRKYINILYIYMCIYKNLYLCIYILYLYQSMVNWCFMLVVEPGNPSSKVLLG